MPAVARRGWTQRVPLRDCVGPNNYVVNLVRVIQGFTPPVVHSRADEIYNFNFKWWNTIRKNVGILCFKTIKKLVTQSIIGDERKLEAKVFFFVMT